MKNTPLSAGDIIDARCGKCRAITNHVIVAMTDDVPAKVQCNTCNGQHKYRVPTVPKKPAAKRVTRPKKAEVNEWEELRPSMDENKANAYSMTGSYKVNALIKHTVFGLGKVMRVAGPRKIEVLFQDGLKILRCQ